MHVILRYEIYNIACNITCDIMEFHVMNFKYRHKKFKAHCKVRSKCNKHRLSHTGETRKHSEHSYF